MHHQCNEKDQPSADSVHRGCFVAPNVHPHWAQYSLYQRIQGHLWCGDVTRCPGNQHKTHPEYSKALQHYVDKVYSRQCCQVRTSASGNCNFVGACNELKYWVRLQKTKSNLLNAAKNPATILHGIISISTLFSERKRANIACEVRREIQLSRSYPLPKDNQRSITMYRPNETLDPIAQSKPNELFPTCSESLPSATSPAKMRIIAAIQTNDVPMVSFVAFSFNKYQLKIAANTGLDAWMTSTFAADVFARATSMAVILNPKTRPVKVPHRPSARILFQVFHFSEIAKPTSINNANNKFL